MDQVMDGGRFPLEQWFWEMPFCTRWWTTTTFAISVLVQCQIVTPWQLFYSYSSVFAKGQYWRLLSTFLYFGPISMDLVFHIYFLQRYSRLLEESAGRSPAVFSWLLVYAMAFLLVISSFIHMPFLGQPLSSTLVYIWSRRNHNTRLSFLGLMTFSAPYLPWVLMCFSLVLHGSIPRDEIMGVVIGHVYWFFTDVYPPLHNGVQPLAPPSWWRWIFEGQRPQANNDMQAVDETAGAVDQDFAAARAERIPELR
ncbi:ER-associated proteolytic system protein [Grosmannia clavigera kw1407]|uniref:Derlin n=1 Tax=Grosmannia clavigera (strain kw1407 / UAMH 11150) TaxID=655863 RepID=F0XPV1_GROCL|nr:ER-associated proteolytic system protein [Grosmannia clavigera kw1407]EFX00531.1 ER-associated proteolytic system protein [Grosmannia clavigera kw1407]